MKTLQTRSRTLEHTLKTWLTPVRKQIVHIRTEKKCSLNLPVLKRIKAWRRGFTTASYALYGLDRNPSGEYLKDFSDINYLLNNPGAGSVNDKFMFAHMMRHGNIPSPDILALVMGGSVAYPIQQAGPDRKDLAAHVEALLETSGKLVLKPCFGGGGRGVFFLEASRSGLTMNQEPTTLFQVCNRIKNQPNTIITGFVEQADYAMAIYPRVANTIRILTIWDSSGQQPVIVRASHRFGSGRSFPVDNFHGGLGGLCSPIDLGSGELGPGLGLSGTGRITQYDIHPETGGQIAGTLLPHWEGVKSLVLAAARLYAVSVYVGWDIIVTDTGCSFIEGNSPPGVAVWQVHGPLLRDERLRRFYREQGMLA